MTDVVMPLVTTPLEQAMVIPTPGTAQVQLGGLIAGAPTYNVKNFGATGSGNSSGTGTDDSTAIQAAFDACVATGGTVYFPAGIYNTTKPIIVKPGAAGHPAIAIKGERCQDTTVGSSLISNFGNYAGATFTGTISGTILTVTAVSSGIILLGTYLTGTGIQVGTYIISQASGTAGGIGTYNISWSQTVSSSITITSTDLTGGFQIISAQGGILAGQGVGLGGVGQCPVSGNGVSLIENMFFQNYGAGGVGSCLLLSSCAYGVVRCCNLTVSKGIAITTVGPVIPSTSPTGPTAGIAHIEFCSISGGGVGSIGVYVSTGTVLATNVQGLDTAYIGVIAAPNIIGCRAEVCNTGVMLGFDPYYGTGSTNQATGGQIIGCQFESCNTFFNLSSAAYTLIAGNAFTSALAAAGFPTGHTYSMYAVYAGLIDHVSFISNYFNNSFDVACIWVQSAAQGCVFLATGVGTGAGAGVFWGGPGLSPSSGLDEQIMVLPPLSKLGLPSTMTRRTFAQLPATWHVTEGMRFIISDCLNSAGGTIGGSPPIFGQAIASGGGPFVAEVRYNGTNWTVSGL